MKRFLWVFGSLAVLFLLQSCFTNNEPSDSGSDDDKGAVKGSYIYGNEVSSFQPCGLETELWVTGNESLMTKLENDYMAMVNKPYQQVFVSFKGHKLAKAKDGFAADYDGQFRVTKVITMQKENICL